MRKQTGRILISLILILFGVAALLNNLGFIYLPFVITGPNAIWAFIFGLAAVAFIVTFGSDLNSNWWAIIPGMTFVGLTVLVGGLIPASLENWGGAVFLCSIGLSFWIIFIIRREFWWAIIPGGALLTIGLISGLSELANGFAIASALFLGLGITFFIVFLFANPGGNRMPWALYPAAVLGIMGVLFLFGAGGIINILGSVAIIVAGGYLIVRTVMKR
jgi:hypothetical protein